MLLEISKTNWYSEARLQAGPLDATKASELKASFVSFLQSDAPKNLFLHLDQCQHCDINGISALHFGQRLLEQVQAKLVLIGASENFKNFLAISQLSDTFLLANNPEEAQHYLKS